jgi:hypothetical protein
LTYEYKKSLKSSLSDELINTYLLRPLAGLIVWVLYRTPITPNQVTIASTIAGFVAAGLYLKNEALYTAVAGLCVTLKDVLDSADGQLARAKQRRYPMRTVNRSVSNSFPALLHKGCSKSSKSGCEAVKGDTNSTKRRSRR